MRTFSARILLAFAACGLLLATPVRAQSVAQTRHWVGQGVAPVYEGFDINPDGTYNMWFGYMNRNFEEELDIPLGADNKFEPGRRSRPANAFRHPPPQGRVQASSCRRTSARTANWCGR